MTLPRELLQDIKRAAYDAKVREMEATQRCEYARVAGGCPAFVRCTTCPENVGKRAS